MIRRVFLIGWQEFVKYVTRRGFLISLFMVPLLLVLGLTIPKFTGATSRTNVMTVIDRAGGYADAIRVAAARERAKADLWALAAYAKRYADLHAVERRDRALAGILAAPERIAEVKAFEARGGWQSAFAVLSPLLQPGAPVFTPPPPAVIVVSAPPELVFGPASVHAGAALAYLTGTVNLTSEGRPVRLSSIVFVPKGFGPGSNVSAEYWTIDNAQSFEFVHSTLTDALRVRAIRQLVPAADGDKVSLDVDAGLTSIDPTRGKEMSLEDRMAQLVPVGLAFVLFIVAFSDAALLLQSVVEEKSTRMIEVLLSCASPHEIMTGKLMGVIGLALVTLAAWAFIIFVFVSFLSPGAIGPVVAGLKGLLPLLPLVLVYFFCGLMIYASIFLGIGATANSLPDAQTLIGPASMIIVLPNMLIGALVQNPNGTLAQVISWIPIYTPFFMLVRLPFHPAPIELWLTAILTVATTVLLIRQMGRVFARHVLTTERPPALGALLKSVFRTSR
jgi:ABC-2 type transport system permease protein